MESISWRGMMHACGAFIIPASCLVLSKHGAEDGEK